MQNLRFDQLGCKIKTGESKPYILEMYWYAKLGFMSEIEFSSKKMKTFHHISKIELFLSEIILC